MAENQDGIFRHRKVNFSAVSNSALQDNRLSLKAKGLYSLIQALINKPNYELRKWYLIKQCKEGEKAFDSAWKELKDTGYLKIYRIPSGTNDRFKYEYELLDEADESIPALSNLSKNREVIPPKDKKREQENSHTPQKGVYAKNSTDEDGFPHYPLNGGNADEDVISHTPHFVPNADGTLCEPHLMPNGGKRRNTEPRNTKLRNIKSISQSGDDGLTDEIRGNMKEQIEYDYFEENNPNDITGVDVIVDCMVDMLSRPSTKINGVDQSREALAHYISLADSCTVREFLEHMQSKQISKVKNISAYWQTALINFLREQELLKIRA